MKNIKAIVSYDGTNYEGWQVQPSALLTIQGQIEAVISRLLQKEIKIYGAGRTDAGVHAKAQVCNFFIDDEEINLSKFQYAMNGLLPKDVRIESLEFVSTDFNSQKSATGKIYKYYICDVKQPLPFTKNFIWFIPKKINVNAMIIASKYLEGEHDFESFRVNGTPVKSTVRTIYSIEITQKNLGYFANEKIIEMRFHGNGFLKQMVRSIVGTLVDIGLEKYPPENIKEILEGKNRKLAGQTAPALGLFLDEVFY